MQYTLSGNPTTHEAQLSQLVFRMCWNPEEVCCNADGGVVLPVRAGRSRGQASFFHVRYIGLPAEGLAQSKGGSIVSPQRSGLEGGFPVSNDFIRKKKIPHRCTHPFAF